MWTFTVLTTLSISLIMIPQIMTTNTLLLLSYKKQGDHFILLIESLPPPCASVAPSPGARAESIELISQHTLQAHFKLLVQTMRSSVVVSIMFTAVINTMLATAAVQHKVGGTLGWNYPPNQGAEFFANWAAQNKFHVGDSLYFEYIAGTHNVLQVDRSDYEACTSYRPMQLYSANKVVVNLPNPGTYYYICGVKGHCEYGMKVALTVT